MFPLSFFFFLSGVSFILLCMNKIGFQKEIIIMMRLYSIETPKITILQTKRDRQHLAHKKKGQTDVPQWRKICL